MCRKYDETSLKATALISKRNNLFTIPLCKDINMVKVLGNIVSQLVHLLPWKIRKKKNSLPPANICTWAIIGASISNTLYCYLKSSIRIDYLAAAVPKRTAKSWYLFSCFSMKVRWLLTPQIMIWSASITCICAPSLSFCMLFCRNDHKKINEHTYRL